MPSTNKDADMGDLTELFKEIEAIEAAHCAAVEQEAAKDPRIAELLRDLDSLDSL